jgi:hypothetical protein
LVLLFAVVGVVLTEAGQQPGGGGWLPAKVSERLFPVYADCGLLQLFIMS